MRAFMDSSGYSHKSQVWTTIGMWAWVLHRLTGLGLALYLFIHIVLMGLSLLRGEEAFDAALSVLMGSRFFGLLETLLLAAVLYHGFNGIRILLFDMGLGIGVRAQKIIFWVFMGMAAILWLWSIAAKL
jgi:succinate dehydrogenase / fumarate reductase cytochrome b subunit